MRPPHLGHWWPVGRLGDVGQPADGEVARVVGPGVVVALVVGPDDEVAAVLDGCIGDDHHAGLVHAAGATQADAGGIARHGADGAYLLVGRRAQLSRRRWR
jgi:hypothetical protein